MSNVLWTVTTDWENAHTKTDNTPAVYLTKKEYTAEEYAVIRAEADEWNVEVTRENGYDYGYGRSEYHHSIWYEEIADDILIVKDGHFPG